jgi:hypothetical protein
MQFKKLVLAMAVAMAVGTSAFAAVPAAVGPSDGDLKWNGSIDQMCNLQNFKDGTVVATIDQTELSSTLEGGSAAHVTIRSNANGYSLVLGTPILTGPNGEEKDVSFKIDPLGSGTDLVGTVKGNFGAKNGVMYFDSGIYSVDVGANATKNTGAFQAGTYLVKVPVTCVKAG